MSYLLTQLNTKKEVDRVIKTTQDKVLVLRFGRDSDQTCLQLDDIVRMTEKYCTFESESIHNKEGKSID